MLVAAATSTQFRKRCKTNRKVRGNPEVRVIRPRHSKTPPNEMGHQNENVKKSIGFISKNVAQPHPESPVLNSGVKVAS